MTKLYHGAAYYPEQWDADTIAKDIKIMKEAGINVVRMGEFAWSCMEPHRGVFYEDFFCETIESLCKEGISTIICTPTATPPIWMSHNHPERMLVDKNNTAMVHGGRQHVCTNNEFFRERMSLIVEKMAKAYGGLEGVIAWQIDNELKGNVSECYCDTCKNLWHDWLKTKYTEIDALNRAWGTRVWSQYYEDFSQVPQPLKTPVGHNPSLTTAYQIFSREKTAEFIKVQADIIRIYSSAPITHNSSLYHYMDNRSSFEPLDFASFDHYSESDEYHKIIFWADTFRRLKADKPFWAMETSPSNSASIYGHQRIHKNGYLAAEAAAIYAMGGQGFCYWLLRQNRTGAEQPHGHLITSWGEKSPGFHNAQQVSELKNVLEPILAKTYPAKAPLAVTYSDKARVFFMTEPLENTCFDYREEMMKLHNVILNAGIHRDYLFEDISFDGYKVLFTPYLPYVSESYLESAKNFVINGGIWIVGPLTGTRTQEHTIHTDSALGGLEEFAGVKALYHYPMSGADTTGHAFGESAQLTLYSTLFECIDAAPMGLTQGGVTPDMTFITESRRGKGKVIMLGSMPCDDSGKNMIKKMLLHYLGQADAHFPSHTQGTIVVPRKGEGLEQWVVINMDGRGGTVAICSDGVDAVTRRPIEAGTVVIEPYGYKVIEFQG